MLLLYRIGIKSYGFIVWLFSFFNEKAKQFIDGRKEIFSQLQEELKDTRPIWIHAASLGEFEQGRPIIEAIKKEEPDQKILLTFFSPSGFEIRKDYELADWVYYLPLDSPRNARKFVSIVNPRVAIFIKYEFWYFFLRELQEKNIPTIMVSAIFRDSQLFFHWSGRFFHSVFKSINHFYVQDKVSEELISKISKNVTIAGDTRFDRVLDIASKAKKIKKIDAFVGEKKVFVLGSTWPSDIEIIGEFVRKRQKEMKFIIAPHNVGDKDIQQLEDEFENTARFSNYKNEECQILIIDNMGMLSSIYSYADYAFIGGAFRGALHNTLEAAVYGVPVFFGDHEKNQKFAEAMELVNIGGAFAFSKVEDFETKFEELNSNEEVYEAMSNITGEYVKSKSGATKLVMSRVSNFL